MALLVKVLISVFTVAAVTSSVAARRVNITVLDNCKDLDPHEKPSAYLTAVDYHIDEGGYCDIVHGNVAITTVDPEPLLLNMTLFKCEELGMKEPCLGSPTYHIESLDCERIMNDTSGPWHMFSSGMDSGQCGDLIGHFPLSFARLRLEYLMKYLDVYDALWNTFRLKMYFESTRDNVVRGCLELDFELLPLD